MTADRWFGLALIAGALAWKAAQLLAARRRRIAWDRSTYTILNTVGYCCDEHSGWTEADEIEYRRMLRGTA